MKKKILHISACSIKGGVSTYVLKLMEKIDNSKFTSKAIIPDRDGVRELLKNRKLNIDYAKVTRLPGPSDIKFIICIYQNIKNYRPDIVHVHSTKAGLYGRLLAKIMKIEKVIYTPNAFIFLGYSGWKKIIYILIEKILAKITDVIICVSNSEHEIGNKYGITNVRNSVVINNGVKMPKKITNIQKKLIRKENKFDLKKDIILFPVRLYHQKDPQTFLKAAIKVCDAVKAAKNIIFVLLGGGPLLQNIIKMVKTNDISDKVRFINWVNDPLPFFQIASLVVLTSRFEGMPFAILESFSCSIPVVGTNAIGIKDLIENSWNGYLCEIGDYNCIADRILYLLKNKTQRNKMGKNAKKMIDKNYNIDKMVRITEQIYLR